MRFLRNCFFSRKSDRHGFALVLVLAFVVLLVGVCLAFFSSSLLQAQVSNSSATQVKVGLLADGAVDTIVCDLKAEIVAGSTDVPITTGGVTKHIYAPRSSTAQTYAQNSGAYTTMLPATQGFTRAAYTPGTPDPLANLVKVSAGGAPFYPGGGAYTAAGPARAAASPTNTGARPISPARWNMPLFLAAKDTVDLTPVGNFPVPNWIYVARDGTNKTAPDPDVVGRYAYAVYDEGGLLDINVAGYPSSMAPTAALPDVAYKNALAYADLTAIGLGQDQIDDIIGWRNASSNATTDKYKKYAAFNQSGFLKTVNEDLVAGASDHMFSSRQQFIEFLRTKIPGFNKATQDTLQYLTTFSRDLDQPSCIRLQSTDSSQQLDYNPAVPKVLPLSQGGNVLAGKDAKVNPSFLRIRVPASFLRNDGSPAVPEEPLVKRRFALNRLAWLTYKGPSHDRSQSDADIQALIKYGIPWSYLQNGTAENIRKYFGLSWDGSQWKYDQHAKSGAAGEILTLEEVAALGTREPNFFELLKAAINVGSLGKSVAPVATVAADPGAFPNDQPFNYNSYAETSVDFQILQIGANIISQFQPSNYPPRIAYDDGKGTLHSSRTIVGVANLPYFYGVITGILRMKPATTTPPNVLPDGNQKYPATTKITDEGAGALMETPILWNPHDPSSPTTNATGLSPTRIRVVADSAAPDRLDVPSDRDAFFTYAGAIGALASTSDENQFSYKASTGASWYHGILPHPFNADNTAITMQITPPATNPTTQSA
jgi:hypothetical protein